MERPERVNILGTPVHQFDRPPTSGTRMSRYATSDIAELSLEYITRLGWKIESEVKLEGMENFGVWRDQISLALRELGIQPQDLHLVPDAVGARIQKEIRRSISSEVKRLLKSSNTPADLINEVYQLVRGDIHTAQVKYWIQLCNFDFRPKESLEDLLHRYTELVNQASGYDIVLEETQMIAGLLSATSRRYPEISATFSGATYVDLYTFIRRFARSLEGDTPSTPKMTPPKLVSFASRVSKTPTPETKSTKQSVSPTKMSKSKPVILKPPKTEDSHRAKQQKNHRVPRMFPVAEWVDGLTRPTV